MTERQSSVPQDVRALHNASCACGRPATRVRVIESDHNVAIAGRFLPVEIGMTRYVYGCDAHPEGYEPEARA